MSRRGDSTVLTTLIILVASVVLGTGVILYGASFSTQSPVNTIEKSPPSKNMNLIDNETAVEMQIDKMLTTDQYCCQLDYNHKLVIDRSLSNSVYTILSSKITIRQQQDYGEGQIIPLSNTLAQHINQTLHKLKKEFNDTPFIVKYTYSPSEVGQNRVVKTITGIVDYNSTFIPDTLNDYTYLKITNMPAGTWIKLNYVLHNHPCILKSIQLSNQTNPIISGNLDDIISNPTHHGLLSLKDADNLFHTWIEGKTTTDPTYTHGTNWGYWDYSTCQPNDSYSYEMVESHAS